RELGHVRKGMPFYFVRQSCCLSHGARFALLLPVFGMLTACFHSVFLTRATAPGPLFSAIVESRFGAVGVRSDGRLVQEIVFLPPAFHEKSPTDAVAERAAVQLERYFADPDYRFDLPLAAVGTAFQQRVWCAISAIPRGEVLTY